MKKGAGSRKKWIKFLLMLILILMVAGAYLYVKDTRLEAESIVIEGNHRYTESELLKLIFPEDEDWQTLTVWWNEYKGIHQDIPFISRYEITLTGLHSAEIMVYEKNIVACLEYMDSIKVTKKNGTESERVAFI